MKYIRATAEFGIVIRRKALADRNVHIDAVLSAMQVDKPFDFNDHLISFGPSFGQEALDVFVKRLMALGLEYFDDFFEFSGQFPNWCEFLVSCPTIR